MSIIYHCPHGKHREVVWDEFLQKAKTILTDDSLTGKYPQPEDLTFITYHNKPGKCLLEKQLVHYGFSNYVVLARAIRNWSWMAKVAPVVRFLESRCTSGYVACLDGHDVIITDPTPLMREFRSLDCDILFCGTPNDFPRNPECSAFEIATYPNQRQRHLNSGCYIGKSGFVLQCLSEIQMALGQSWTKSPKGLFDDQMAWRHKHKEYFPRIKVDVEERVFRRVGR